ncbi:phosphoribosylaminoimidazolesuccinocarboxamide synthase [Candidatus Woesearchaeota archaeon]|nr:phosphoribosylaminoimidazolesuccinocarboxamide synthase [Candidatus Woesearchaeota archaeon]
MKDNEIVRHIPLALDKTDFKIGKKYAGKVRDSYIIKDKRIIIATDRISCFDSVVGTLPFKGQILNEIATMWFERTARIVKNHLIESPDPNVSVVLECKPLPVEVVVRGYLTGSLWRDYQNGKRDMYGLEFPEDMKKDQHFPKPIITPTTKADKGHDEAITRGGIIKNGLVDEKLWEQIEDVSIKLFNFGTEFLKKYGLILVDTKYEFGLYNDELVLMDEIHTPDSSRFWYRDGYEARFRTGQEQKMIDKEYVRQWLISKGWMGDGVQPKLTREVIVEAVKRYLDAFEKITGHGFIPGATPILERIENNLERTGYLK